MDITLREAAGLLLSHQDITILTHRKPDGDTLGSAFALYFAFTDLGRSARVLCADGYPDRYSFLYGDNYVPTPPPPHSFVVAVDTASPELLGGLAESYGDKVDLVIDHHGSNSGYGQNSVIQSGAAATAEIIAELIPLLGAQITPAIADALYTGIATDTGCFRYTNTTANTHRVAAALIEQGAQSALINRLMFETKSKGLLAAETMIQGSLEFYFEGRCAVIYITEAMLAATGVNDYDLEGVASLPRQIEGVEAGVTIRKHGDHCRISLRTCTWLDAAAVCQTLGGGGHPRAGGCLVKGDAATALKVMLNALHPYLGGDQTP